MTDIKMTDIKSYLEGHMQKASLVDIQTCLDIESTITGFVNQVSDDLVCVVEVDDDGTYDGFTIFEIKNIYCVRFENEQLKTISNLVQKRSKIPKIKQIDMTTLLTAIKEIDKNYEYVSLFLENIDSEQCYVGNVMDIEELLLLHEYTPLDNPQRSQVVLRFKDITRVGHGGKYEEGVIKLFKTELRWQQPN